MNEPKKPNKTNFFALLLSTFAAAFGVQTHKNLERDFQQKSVMPFIAAGVIFTVLFMTSLILIVRWVVSS